MRKMTLLFVAALVLSMMATGAWASTKTYQWDDNDFDNSTSYGFSTTHPGVPGYGYAFANEWTISDAPTGGWQVLDSAYVDLDIGTANDGTFQAIDLFVWKYNTGTSSWDTLYTEKGITSITDGWNTYAFKPADWASPAANKWNNGDLFRVGYTQWYKALAVFDLEPSAGNPTKQNAGAIAYNGNPNANTMTDYTSGGDLRLRVNASNAPEPASLVLLGCAAGAGALVRRRKSNKCK